MAMHQLPSDPDLGPHRRDDHKPWSGVEEQKRITEVLTQTSKCFLIKLNSFLAQNHEFQTIQAILNADF